MTDRRRERGPYADRADAGTELAGHLGHLAGRQDVVVLALPRGGVPVAEPVAAALGAPLDVLVVRKLRTPGHPELAMGAVAGVAGSVEVVREERVLDRIGPGDAVFDAACRAEADELRRRESAYRERRPAQPVRDRVAVLVDDGLATGASMRAAVAAVRRQHPSRVVVAVPIGSPRTCALLAEEADEVVCPWQPDRFAAVGQGYRDFRQTPDEEVLRILARPAGPASPRR